MNSVASKQRAGLLVDINSTLMNQDHEFNDDPVGTEGLIRIKTFITLYFMYVLL